MRGSGAVAIGGPVPTTVHVHTFVAPHTWGAEEFGTLPGLQVAPRWAAEAGAVSEAVRRVLRRQDESVRARHTPDPRHASWRACCFSQRAMTWTGFCGALALCESGSPLGYSANSSGSIAVLRHFCAEVASLLPESSSPSLRLCSGKRGEVGGRDLQGCWAARARHQLSPASGGSRSRPQK